MEQSKLVEILDTISKRPRPQLKEGAKTIYLGSPWFSPSQEQFLIDQFKALMANPTVAYVHVPLLGQFSEDDPTDGFENDAVAQEWGIHTFANDIASMDLCDMAVALIEPHDIDPGLVWEMGYMFANHKPVISVISGDTYKNAINLMPAMGTATYVDKEAIQNYDFRRPLKSFYRGSYI